MLGTAYRDRAQNDRYARLLDAREQAANAVACEEDRLQNTIAVALIETQRLREATLDDMALIARIGFALAQQGGLLRYRAGKVEAARLALEQAEAALDRLR